MGWKQQILTCGTVAGGIALSGMVAMGKISPATAMDIGVGFITVDSLYVVCKVPWDLYFLAKKGGLEIAESRKRDIEVNEHDASLCSRWKGRLLLAALGGHLLSAAGVWFLSEHTTVVHKEFAFAFVGTALVRPLFNLCHYLKKRLADLKIRVMIPYRDCVTMSKEAEELAKEIGKHKKEVQHLREREKKLIEGNQSFHNLLNHAQSDILSKRSKLEASYNSSARQIAKDEDMLRGLRQFIAFIRAPPVQ